jgi:DNA (cytosine-5)-methyltransferase 1
VTFTFYDFFAGGGMAGVGLGPAWRCLFANDFSAEKCAAFRANFDAPAPICADVASLRAHDLPGGGAVDLMWASPPCQDLSLAGERAGLEGERSGAVWPFLRLIRALKALEIKGTVEIEFKGYARPTLIAIENVPGLITSRDGDDFNNICAALAAMDYQVGALVIDADLFVPQSRRRLIIIGLRHDVYLDADIPISILGADASDLWQPPALRAAVMALPNVAWDARLWFNPQPPPPRATALADLIEAEPSGGVKWNSEAKTARLLDLMNDAHRAQVDAALAAGRRTIGAVYRRTRPDGSGGKTQRAEVRFDGRTGCLRTPAGGSSRQTILIIEGGVVRSRLLMPREGARLMGLPESYVLPQNYNEAFRLLGDGVAAPVVRFLAATIFEPIIKAEHAERARRRAVLTAIAEGSGCSLLEPE